MKNADLKNMNALTHTVSPVKLPSRGPGSWPLEALGVFNRTETGVFIRQSVRAVGTSMQNTETHLPTHMRYITPPPTHPVMNGMNVVRGIG